MTDTDDPLICLSIDHINVTLVSCETKTNECLGLVHRECVVIGNKWQQTSHQASHQVIYFNSHRLSLHQHIRPNTHQFSITRSSFSKMEFVNSHLIVRLEFTSRDDRLLQLWFGSRKSAPEPTLCSANKNKKFMHIFDSSLVNYIFPIKIRCKYVWAYTYGHEGMWVVELNLSAMDIIRSV